MSQLKALAGALPKVTAEERARLKYLSTIPPSRSAACSCKADPVSIWWPESRSSILFITSVAARPALPLPHRGFQRLEEGFVPLQFGRARRMRAGRAEPARDSDGFHFDIDRLWLIRGQTEPDLATPGQLDIDLRQQLRVEQCPVAGAMASVDAIARAKRIQRMLGPGMAPPGERQRIHHPVVPHRLQAGDAQFRIEEAEIEHRIMRDQRRIADEFEEGPGFLREWRLVC